MILLIYARYILLLLLGRKQAGLRFLSYIFLHDISVIYATLGYTQFMAVEEFESSS